MGPIEDGVAEVVAGLERPRAAYVALALNLARELDSEFTQAYTKPGLSKELRATLAELLPKETVTDDGDARLSAFLSSLGPTMGDAAQPSA